MVIQGTRNFDDYNIFLRAMGTALSTVKPEDKSVTIYSVGPANINSFAQEFSNISERSLKARGIRIKFNKVPFTWVHDNISDVDYFVYLSKPKEAVSSLVDFAELNDVEVGIYRY